MKFIRTQDGAILNLAHIIYIDLMEGEATEKGATTKAYAVAAYDIRGKEHQVVISDTAEESEAALAEIIAWIAYSKEDILDLSETEAEPDEDE